MIVSDFELKVENELDDIEREMSFYNHALAAVAEGRSRMKELGMPIYRPEDYFCEQIKSDAHMARVCPFTYSFFLSIYLYSLYFRLRIALS